jgi:putative nucleotidyltransferase with HDIG domain
MTKKHTRSSSFVVFPRVTLLAQLGRVYRRLVIAAGVLGGASFVNERRQRRRAERFAAAALESLLLAIDANDPQTGAHVRRVASYALVIADALGLDERELRTIELAALFHDIGKIHEALFDIVHQPRKLTPAERRAIATHPERGAEVLAPIANVHPRLADAVLSHHERWDGTGYPRRLRGRHIPLAARVVSIADTFDAVSHDRRYRDGRAPAKAAEIVLAGRGAQFDPDLVDLVLLPPVLDRLAGALKATTRRAHAPPRRRTGAGHDLQPDIEIRWRTRTAFPRDSKVIKR